MSDFRAPLKTHLEFLDRSCLAYDDGHRAEALRMAVSLRVMFHDTHASTSLLTHLGARGSVHLSSTFVSQKSMEKEFPGFKWHTVLPVMLTSHGVKAPTNSWKVRSVLAAEDWWNEEIWAEGGRALARRDVVLSAANQDGGAHVDNKPSDKTKMVKSGPSGEVRINGVPLEGGMENHHYPLIRQMAYEVSISEELERLAREA